MLYRHLGILVISLTFFAGCASHQPVVPPGTIPQERTLSAEDEQYGHEVLSELSQQYPLDRDDAHINRVRDVVDKITDKGIASKNPWHVYVLISSDFKNAAATRGDYIFVWTGLLDSLKNDDELATILAHEIGHVLAGHTAPSPSEEASQILSGAAGEIASQILAIRGVPGVLGDLAGELVSASLEALFLNPSQRSKELEADLIGMFLMAKSGIDPQHAIDFWARVQSDPNFANDTLTFLSSHPSSVDRLKQLEQFLNQAKEVYYAEHPGVPHTTPPASASSRKVRQVPHSQSAGFALGSSPQATPQKRDFAASAPHLSNSHTWRVEEDGTTIFSEPNTGATTLGSLNRGAQVEVEEDQRRWLKISAPQAGYVQSKNLSPLRNSRRK